MFTEEFGRYVLGDGSARITCTVDGFDCVATVYHDDDASPPWERDCGHGPVSEWRDVESKEPGERILSQDHGRARFYNYDEAWKIAERDWIGPSKRGEGSRRVRAARAAEQDYAALKAWCDDEWHYSGVAVRIYRCDVALTGQYEFALWGVERNYPGSDNGYLREVANELLGEALEAARAKLAQLAEGVSP